MHMSERCGGELRRRKFGVAMIILLDRADFSRLWLRLMVRDGCKRRRGLHGSSPQESWDHCISGCGCAVAGSTVEHTSAFFESANC